MKIPVSEHRERCRIGVNPEVGTSANITRFGTNNEPWGVRPLEFLPFGRANESSGPQQSRTSSHVNATSNIVAPPGGSSENTDFSEFLWMENEEEFDQQVLRELEEGISHFDTANGSTGSSGASAAPLTGRQWTLSGCGVGEQVPVVNSTSSSEIRSESSYSDAVVYSRDVNALTRDFNRGLRFSSRLNPNAAEFIPRQFNYLKAPQ